MMLVSRQQQENGEQQERQPLHDDARLHQPVSAPRVAAAQHRRDAEPEHGQNAEHRHYQQDRHEHGHPRNMLPRLPRRQGRAARRRADASSILGQLIVMRVGARQVRIGDLQRVGLGHPDGRDVV